MRAFGMVSPQQFLAKAGQDEAEIRASLGFGRRVRRS
jgi:hypothetical protein